MSKTWNDSRYETRDNFFPDAIRPRLNAVDMWLGERISQTNEGHWLVIQEHGGWELLRSQNAALRNAKQNWCGKAHHVTGDDIEKFMKNTAPVVRGKMIVPTTSERGVFFRGALFINCWQDTVLAPDMEAANDISMRPQLTLLLRVLRECLCNGEGVKSLEEMLEIARSHDGSEVEFQFLMDWLATLVQQVGYNMQTNLWLLGDIGGVGKGILTANILPNLLGPQHCADLNAAEIEHGGWTDTISNKLFICVNEINPSGKFDWNSFIKQNSTEPFVQIRKRGTDSFQSINFANWCFTSNNESPECLDAYDRRNALIQTTTDLAKCEIATQLWQWIKTAQADAPQEYRRLLGAFCFLLMKHNINTRSQERAPDTILKRDVQEATSKDLKGLYWLQNDDTYARDEWLPAASYVDHYNHFVSAKQQVDSRAMGAVLGKLARKKFIERDQKYTSKAAYYRINSARFPTTADMARKKDGTNVLALVPRPANR